MWVAVGLIVAGAGMIYGTGSSENAFAERSYGRFESVDIRVPAETVLEHGSDWSVVAEIPERYVRDIHIRNDRGTLVVDTDRSWLRLRPGDVIRLVITMPEFEEVRLTSSGSIVSQDDWTGGTVHVSSTGSGDIRLSGISAEVMKIHSTGSGNVEVASVVAEDVQLRATGSGDIRTGMIEGGDVSIELTGSGDAEISIQAQQLNSSQTGSGSATVDGTVDSATIRTTASGDFRGADLAARSVSIRITGSGDVEIAKGADIEEISMSGSGNFRQR
jgi:hypothetical protein